MFVVGKDGERYEEEIPHFPTCERCKGDGKVNAYHPPLSGQGDWTARMDPCPVCRGTGEDRSKEKVMAGKPVSKESVVRFDDEDEAKVVPVEVRKWGVLYGILPEGKDPKDRKAYRALFADKAEAERYAAL